MLTEYHIEIMFESLGEHLDASALGVMRKANIRQDRFAGQFGHDEYHFDNNAFAKTHAYIEEQRALVIDSLRTRDVDSAWQAFGRMTHSAQDFYAHSNYVTLWLDRFPADRWPRPEEIDPLDRDLLAGPLLSGRIYLLAPIGALDVWASRHGMSAYVVARAISRRGTKAQAYLMPAFERSQNDIKRRIGRAVEGIVNK